MTLDPVAKALDDALVAVMTARAVHRQIRAIGEAEADGKCGHRGRVATNTFDGGETWLCPDCGEQWSG